MSRNLKVIIGAIAVLGTTAANASEFAFDDAYWKRPDTVQHAFPSARSDASAAVSATQSKGPYDLVDNYNP